MSFTSNEKLLAILLFLSMSGIPGIGLAEPAEAIDGSVNGNCPATRADALEVAWTFAESEHTAKVRDEIGLRTLEHAQPAPLTDDENRLVCRQMNHFYSGILDKASNDNEDENPRYHLSYIAHDGGYIVVAHRIVPDGYVLTGTPWEFTVVHDSRLRPVYFQGQLPTEVRDAIISEARLYMHPEDGIIRLEENEAREALQER